MLKQLSSRDWILLAAIAFALGGILAIALLFGRNPNTADSLYVFAALASGGLGAWAWRWLLRRGVAVSLWRGAVTGALIGLLIHPVVWALELSLAALTNQPISGLDMQVNVLQAVVLWPFATVASLIAVGWATAVVCALVGGLLGYLQAGTLGETEPRSTATRVLRAVGGVLALVLTFVLVLGIVPVSTNGLTMTSAPAASYEDARAKLAAIDTAETALPLPLLNECRTTLMTHGRKTDKVVVFYHGLTNCPAQFVPLGQAFFDRGYNVLIARHPHHVYEDRDPSHLRALTAEGYRDMADATLDVARGLGDTVYVVGLSGGGTVAAWIAQNRGDVERVVLLAPFYGSGHVPEWLNLMGVNLYTRLPNVTFPGTTIIPYAYPGNTSRAQGETMRLGEAVRRQSDRLAPMAKSIVLLNNANDRTVDNQMSLDLLNVWAGSGAATEVYEIRREAGLPHDIIDVHQPTQQSDVVYPLVIDLVEGRTPTLP